MYLFLFFSPFRFLVTLARLVGDGLHRAFTVNLDTTISWLFGIAIAIIFGSLVAFTAAFLYLGYQQECVRTANLEFLVEQGAVCMVLTDRNFVTCPVDENESETCNLIQDPNEPVCLPTTLLP